MWIFKRNIKIFIWKGGKWQTFKKTRAVRAPLMAGQGKALYPQRSYHNGTTKGVTV